MIRETGMLRSSESDKGIFTAKFAGIPSIEKLKEEDYDKLIYGDDFLNKSTSEEIITTVSFQIDPKEYDEYSVLALKDVDGFCSELIKRGILTKENHAEIVKVTLLEV